MTADSTVDRRGEHGYVLLALLASTAVIIATLALSLPRMAMQSQRAKEQGLIERGEQYRRAIELYYRDHGKYPEELEDIEETDGVRYLRRRSEDPMGATGEWRIIHMGTDGRFEDSLLYDTEKEREQMGQGAFGQLSDGTDTSPTGADIPSIPGYPAGPMPGGPYVPQDGRTGPGLQPLIGAARARTARESAAPDLLERDRYSQGFGFNTNQVPADQMPADPRQDRSRMLPSMVPLDENEWPAEVRYGGENLPAEPVDILPGTVSGFAPSDGNAGPPAAGPNTAVGPGQAGLAAGSGAPEMIHQILTTPRSADQDGLPGAQSTAQAQQVFERGIAGVASTSEEVGIKVYNGKQAFNEWEFVFDYREMNNGSGRNRRRRQPADVRTAPSPQTGTRPRGTTSRGRAGTRR